MKKPEVSIVIPVYNGGKTLPSCIQSILNQNYNNYELNIINNDSKDNTERIIKKFNKKNKKIRYFFEKQKTRGAARYRGEINSKGKIILMTDSDCIVPKDWIEKMINPILFKNFQAVQGFQKEISKSRLSKKIQNEIEKKYSSMETLEKEKIIGMIDTKNFAIKKDLLEKIGYSSKKYFSGNDTELSIKLSKTNIKIKLLKKCKIKHYHSTNLKQIINKQIYRAKWTAIITKDNKNYLKKTDFLKNTNQTFYSFFIFFPSILIKLIKNPKKEYYNLITGISWRLGLLNKISLKIK